MVWNSVFTPWMWQLIIGPHSRWVSWIPQVKNQLNTSRMELSLLPNAVKLVHKVEKQVINVFFFFFFSQSGLLLHHAMATKNTRNNKYKGKKKTQGSQEDHISSKVGFFKFCYLLFLTNNYETVILKQRHHFL